MGSVIVYHHYHSEVFNHSRSSSVVFERSFHIYTCIRSPMYMCVYAYIYVHICMCVYISVYTQAAVFLVLKCQFCKSFGGIGCLLLI